jgi:uncharacterized damage-inducible protein DinB
MDVRPLLTRLEAFPAAREGLLGDLPLADWRWRPAEGAWSILEVVNHLADEETEDFRARVRSTLEDPGADWAPIDPAGAVEARRYADRDPAESLRRFRAERERSLAWLRSLSSPRWENARPHPTAGTLRAGDLLASWAAHDARHLAQIGRLLHGLAIRDGAPYSVAYAG